MGEPSSQEHKINGLGLPFDGQSDSVMREFIESGEKIEWTDEFGTCGPDENHCLIFKSFPFRTKTIFTGKSYVARCKVDSEMAPTFPFKREFAEKRLQKTSVGREDKTKAEISIMKNLRHPHIVAFLGSWERIGRLSILMFPPACFDLEKFMGEISTDLEHLRDSASQQTDPSVLKPSIALPGRWSRPLSSSRPDCEAPCLQKLLMIRRYFVCLSQALAYIHKQGIRHKDIKPKNILIDESGSAVVTDFGISKHFPWNVSHDTHEHQKYDPKYVSPEMFDDRPRGDLSDVFSLGGVFLEMATLLSGKTLNDLNKQYMPKPTDPDLATKDGGYHWNLDGVYEWISLLGDLRGKGPAETEGDEFADGDVSHQDFMSHKAPWSQALIETLPSIKSMMAHDQEHRPKAAGLWSRFQELAPERCRDCDPRHPDVWKPTAAQEAAANKSLNEQEDRDRPCSQSHQEPVEDSETNPGADSRLNRLVQLPHQHQAPPRDDIAHDTSNTAAKDMAISDPGGLARRPDGGDAVTADLGLMRPTADVTSGDNTQASPETVNEKARVLIHDHARNDTYYAPLYTLKGLDHPMSACFDRTTIYSGVGRHHTRQAISRFATEVAFYNDDGKLIEETKLDVGPFLRFRRALGQCPYIYLVNYPSD